LTFDDSLPFSRFCWYPSTIAPQATQQRFGQRSRPGLPGKMSSKRRTSIRGSALGRNFDWQSLPARIDGKRALQLLNNYRLKPVGWVATENRLKYGGARTLRRTLRAASALRRRPAIRENPVSRKFSARHVENVRHVNSQAKVKPAGI
jgi:hypothetical protein